MGKIKIKPLFCQCLTSVSTIETVSTKAPVIGGCYSKLFYYSMIEKEIETAGLKSGMCIANIGCGPFPISAIQLAKKGYFVDCFDINKKAIRRAQVYVDKIGLRDKIKIFHAQNEKPFYNRYDAIFISLHIVGKIDLLKNILDNLDTGKIVVYRNPAGWLKRYYEVYYPEVAELNHCVKIRQPLLKESVVLWR